MSDRDTWFGIPVSAPARTVVDLARVDAGSGLMAADAALHEGLFEPADLEPIIHRAAGMPGIRRARQVLAVASPLIESPLESLTHLALHDSGFAPPEPQYWIRGANDRRYRVDFAWPEFRLVLEADGRDKYIGDQSWAEKKRELAIIRAGWRVIRVVWTDVVDDWPATSAWIREVMFTKPLR